MNSAVKAAGKRIVEPVGGFLARTGITPNQITVAGLFFSVAAAAAVATGRLRFAGVLLLIGASCDMLDGAAARAAVRSSRFGAFFDSVVDRISELAVFGGLIAYFLFVAPSFLWVDSPRIHALLAFVSLGGSFLVSYCRARAEGLGIDCRVGVMERPERLALLIVALFLGPIGVQIAVWLLAPLVIVTVVQRVVHVRGALGPR